MVMKEKKHSSEIFMQVVFCDSAFRGLEHSPVLQGLDLIILNYTNLAKFMAVRRWKICTFSF